MKKIITTLLALAMILSCVLVLSSCSISIFAPKPELDLEDAAENLEDADYSVSYIDDTDELDVGMEEMLYASEVIDREDFDDEEEYYEALDARNYITIVVYSSKKTADIAYQNAKAELDYEIKSTKLEIKSIQHTLDEYEGDLEDEQIEYYEEKLESLEKALDQLNNTVVGKKGATVWYGTKGAIEDSKG